MSDELKPCPCCNGAAHVTKGHALENVWPHGDFYRVFCGACQLRQLFYKTEVEAIAAWNHRAPAAPAVQPAACGNCFGTGWMVRDPDIGTDQECFACGGSGKFEEDAPAVQTPDAVVVTIAQGSNAGKRVQMLRDLPNGAKLCAAPVPAVPPGYALVPIEPTPEMLEPLARVWCNEHGIDPDAPQPPHGEYPSWYEHCGPYAEMWRTLFAAAPPSPVPQSSHERPITRCAASRDGECTHAKCLQLRDGEPKATGRHCPLDTDGESDD